MLLLLQWCSSCECPSGLLAYLCLYMWIYITNHFCLGDWQINVWGRINITYKYESGSDYIKIFVTHLLCSLSAMGKNWVRIETESERWTKMNNDFMNTVPGMGAPLCGGETLKHFEVMNTVQGLSSGTWSLLKYKECKGFLGSVIYSCFKFSLCCKKRRKWQ